MIVSMMKVLFALSGIESLKDKRQIVRSVRDKLQKKFRLSVAEVALQDSLAFAEMGAALVSNDKDFGETVLRKAFTMIENDVPARIEDVSFYSEEF
ncbi:MAG: DUF503 domain-containing protein [Spirochaetaceae bacterium]|nr:DUF503 domain-containing protein [Spirochaetaceae bacterium]